MPEMTFRTVEVTPQMAKDFLSRNASINRSVTERKVVEYTEDVKEGTFKTTHEPMAFTGTMETGGLIDGQHRCHAIIRANKPVTLVVAEHCYPDTFDKIGCGKPRDAGDLFTIQFKRKYGDSPKHERNVVSTASSMLKRMTVHTPDREMVAEHALRHYHLISRLVTAFGKHKECISTSAIAAFANASLYFGRAKVDPLIERMATQMWNDVNDPLKHLYQRLMREKIREGRYQMRINTLSPGERYSLAVTAIRAALQGRPLARVEVGANDFGETEADRRLRRQPAEVEA